MITATASATIPGVRWAQACSLEDVPPWSGVAALFGRQQIALVRWGDGETIHALGNFDPFAKAFVISRGIVGDYRGEPVIISPLYKQHFRLADGVCVEDPSVSLPVYPVRIEDGAVLVGLPE
jgi:NAD(P)H-dependent nitrite reductase small subunit